MIGVGTGVGIPIGMIRFIPGTVRIAPGALTIRMVPIILMSHTIHTVLIILMALIIRESATIIHQPPDR